MSRAKFVTVTMNASSLWGKYYFRSRWELFPAIIYVSNVHSISIPVYKRQFASTVSVCKNYSLLMCVSLSVLSSMHMWGGGQRAICEPLRSFNHVGIGDWTWIIRHGLLPQVLQSLGLLWQGTTADNRRTITTATGVHISGNLLGIQAKPHLQLCRGFLLPFQLPL